MTSDGLIGRSAPIAVIGAGTMGAGIAQVAVVAGHPVMVDSFRRLEDIRRRLGPPRRREAAAGAG